MAAKSKKNDKGKGKSESSDGNGPGQQSRRGKSLQRFTFATVKRSTISPFECNPRTIDRSAARKLRESVRKFGLVEPLVVNRRTVANGFPPEQEGQLVLLGGHQRAACSDQLAGYNPNSSDDLATFDGTPVNDYDVPVAISEVNSAAEKALVIALNNPSLQGSWDSELLERLVTDPEVNITDTGFDRATLGLMFDQFIVDGVFGKDAAEQVAAEAPIIDIFDDMKAAGKEADAAKKDADKLSSAVATVPSENHSQFSDNDQSQSDSGGLTPERISTTDYSATNADDRRIAAEREAEREPEQATLHSRTQEEILAAERERKIAERQKYIEKAAFDRDTHFMLTVVAETTDELAAWLDELGIELPANRIVSLADLRDAIGELAENESRLS